MLEITDRLQSVTDREKWAARGATFVAKLKATKVVWFPPKPEESGKKSVRAAKKTARRTTKKASSASKKATGTAKKASAARKSTSGAKKVSKRVPAKKAGGS